MRELLQRPAQDAPTAVLDFETTGLDSAVDRVVEVAVLRVEGGRRQQLSQLIDPGLPIPDSATRVHGITDAMVAGQPGFAQLAPQLETLLEGAVVVAHNAPFDLGFLRMERERAGLPSPPTRLAICTLDLSRHVFGLPRCNLHAVATRVSVVHDHAHRALSDVLATWGVYQAMLRSLSLDGPPTVAQVLAQVDNLRAGGPGRERILTRLRQAARSGQPLTIDYTSRMADPEHTPGRLVTRRTISIHKLRLPYIDAWCHLRHEDRVFRVNRIRQVVDPRP